MNCPKCGNEMYSLDVVNIFGIKGNEIETLAEGDLRITACEHCNVAFLSDQPKQIEVPEQSIILPT